MNEGFYIFLITLTTGMFLCYLDNKIDNLKTRVETLEKEREVKR